MKEDIYLKNTWHDLDSAELNMHSTRLQAWWFFNTDNANCFGKKKLDTGFRVRQVGREWQWSALDRVKYIKFSTRVKKFIKKDDSCIGTALFENMKKL